MQHNVVGQMRADHVRQREHMSAVHSPDWKIRKPPRVRAHAVIIVREYEAEN
jgi:hypothetical protein